MYLSVFGIHFNFCEFEISVNYDKYIVGTVLFGVLDHKSLILHLSMVCPQLALSSLAPFYYFLPLLGRVMHFSIHVQVPDLFSEKLFCLHGSLVTNMS